MTDLKSQILNLKFAAIAALILLGLFLAYRLFFFVPDPLITSADVKALSEQTEEGVKKEIAETRDSIAKTAERVEERKKTILHAKEGIAQARKKTDTLMLNRDSEADYSAYSDEELKKYLEGFPVQGSRLNPERGTLNGEPGTLNGKP